MPDLPDLSRSPLWRLRPGAERDQWVRCCAPLLQLGESPPPFDAATEASIDLEHLNRRTARLDLATLAGVPPQAVRARQLALLAGRLCAEAALAAQGVWLDEPIGRDAAGGPRWPAGWTGSITHAAGLAMAAVQRRRGRHDIGLDTEALIVQASVRSAVRAQCVHATEHDTLHAVGQPDGLTLLFSAKEAYYKAVRRVVGRMVDFQEMALSLEPPPDGSLLLRPVAGPVSGLPIARGSVQWIGLRVVTRVAVVEDDDPV